MAALNEAVNATTQAATLTAGLRLLSANAEIPFIQYQRYVLPLDGYVFWIGSASATIYGSIHYAADKQQREDETLAINRVILTTDVEVEPFNVINQNTIWVGSVGSLKFAFSQRGPYYRTSNLFHYSGDAVYPALQSQLIAPGAPLPGEPIVSNSLPAWLALQSYTPVWLAPTNPGVTLYPSFAVPANLPPPYGSVHIEPAQTRALQAIPLRLPANSTHEQLASDRVRVTLYGLNSAQAADFLDLVVQYTEDSGAGFGLMSAPVIRDEKRTQVELGILAMKKTIEFDVDYYQTRINTIARQLIDSVSVAFTHAALYP